MNKVERMAVGALVVILIAWTYFGRPDLPDPETIPDTDVPEEEVVPTEDPVIDDPSADIDEPSPEPAVEEDPVEDVEEADEEPLPDPEIVTLTNEVFAVDFTSHGGGIEAVRLFDYDAAIDRRGEPLELHFGDIPALRYDGIPGFDSPAIFSLEPMSDGMGIRVSHSSDSVRFTRTYLLSDDGYDITVRDSFENLIDETVPFSYLQLHGGNMELQEAGPGMRGMSYLGVDFLPVDARRVTHTSRRVRNYFGVGGGCGTPDLRNVPMTASERYDEEPMEWAAVKNKFFTQIIEPLHGIEALEVKAGRRDDDDFVVSDIRAVLDIPAWELAAGETQETEIAYYAGPKKYAILRQHGNQWADVMEFGRFFKWICQLLLPVLNAIEFVVPGGYGVAVILLTIIVKLVFWPVTHKGTESMKRMQAIQPELKKLREKYKKDPKKLQEKQMLLYREHKVNPLAGCIPMVIQIPVFIGLFTVLRSAVELRYARFLWISDLSEPEGLLSDVITFPASGLNILPLLMTATMVLQQRLTPSAGDPQQQKMMAFMPVMMLFIFYNMPSGLVLYWSVSQALSIVQLYLQRRKGSGLKPVTA